MNIYLVIIICILIFQYVLNFLIAHLNVKSASSILPLEFEGYYDVDKYKKSQEYLKENTRFHEVESTVSLVFMLPFIFLGGFNYFDVWARGFGFGEILTGLIFAGTLMLCSQILSFPFSVYHIFVIEEKYGFNKTTIKIFVADIIKGLILGAIMGGGVFAGIIWFFQKMGDAAWIYSWMGIVLFQLVITFIAPVVIMPLFNKFIPMEEGEVKTAIDAYAKEQDFKLQGIYKMDGSKRSTKSNAFFTGFGKFRRIVLFDTLIEKHTVDELVSVLAHEIGHYKKKHILQTMLISVFTTGLMFYCLSFFINNVDLFEAFGMQDVSIYGSLLFFGFLYAPINMVLSIFYNVFSRKNEYEADVFAVNTYHRAESMINALKKLTVDNLSNLTPHALNVFINYSHPPVLKRIEAIRKIND